MYPIAAFFTAQLTLGLVEMPVPPFAFAFVAIAWSTRVTGPFGRVLAAASCAVWVYARSPMFVALVLTPLEWAAFAGAELLGLLAVGSARRRREVPDTADDAGRRYRALAQTSAAIVWRTSGDGRLLEFLGWTPPPASTRDAWLDLIHPADQPAALAALAHARDFAEPVHLECRVRMTSAGSPAESSVGEHEAAAASAPSPGYRYMHIRGVPIRDAEGRVQEWIGTITDIHEQREATAALSRKEAELATLLNAVPALVFYIDRDFRYVLNNEVFRTWFGLDPAQLRGQRVEEVLGAEAFAQVKPEIDRALNGEQVHFETFLPYQHGGTRWIEAHLTPHRAENGEIRGCVGLVHDIAERKRREQEHGDALARYRFLADAMPQIVWTTLPDGRLDYINWRWFHLTECPVDGNESSYPWLEAVHPEDREATLTHWRRALDSGEAFEIQHRLRRAADCAYLWHLSRAVPRRDARGQIVQWVGSSTDIDQQCRAYAELAEAREELRARAAGLEQRVRERTASLEEANAELRILTTSVSHDLRTPLHIVQSFVDEIIADRENRLSPESAELLDRVSFTTKRMARLMHDLLSYVGISHASQRLRKVALGEIVSEVIEQHRTSIQATNATVTVQHPLLSVLADPTSTFQVLSNLISNGLKFAAPDRPLKLRIRTEPTASRVRLWIEDNGIGIEGRDQERIFRLFERLDGAKGQPGNGVGLALVRKAMSRMGGSAGVVSQAGYGSSFWVEFEPLAVESLRAETAGEVDSGSRP